MENILRTFYQEIRANSKVGEYKELLQVIENEIDNLNNPYRISKEVAMAILQPHKENKKWRIHTFEGCMGCDVDLSIIKKRLETSQILLAGKNKQSIGHGVAYFDEKRGYMYLETNEKKLKALHKKLKLEF